LPAEVCREVGGDRCASGRSSDGPPRRVAGPQANAALGRAAQALMATVAACRKGIVQGAMPYDPVQVDVFGIGSVRVLEGGGRAAPLYVRIVYARDGGHETRAANIECRINGAGAVVSLR
jgi:hypothetical protein